jgi:hypothetical protein
VLPPKQAAGCAEPRPKTPFPQVVPALTQVAERLAHTAERDSAY